MKKHTVAKGLADRRNNRATEPSDKGFKKSHRVGWLIFILEVKNG